jgi:hypothetical protein
LTRFGANLYSGLFIRSTPAGRPMGRQTKRFSSWLTRNANNPNVAALTAGPPTPSRRLS